MAPHFPAAPAATPPGPGIEISLRIGQRVRHRDHIGQRITGVLHALTLDGDRGLEADIVLDAPIVIPARSDNEHEIRIWRQHVPAHELTAFDDRDELIAETLTALTQIERLSREANGKLIDVPAILGDIARVAIARVNGSAA